MGLQFARALSDKPILPPTSTRASARPPRSPARPRPSTRPTPARARPFTKASGGGVCAAVDFAGSENSLDFRARSVATGGAVIIVGLFGGSLAMPVPMFPLRALTIMGSYVGSPAETREMMALVKAGKVAPIPVELRPLDRAGASLDDLRAGKIVGRVVVTP